MKKIAIVTDSNSGITQSQAKEMGIFVLPMPFMIDNEEHLEDIDLTQEEFYERLLDDANVVTSQPNPETVMDFWRDILADYDEIVHIPMSSGLSGSCQTAQMLSHEDEFEGRVFVANNQRISITQRRSAEDAMYMAKQGKSAEEIRDILEADKFNSSIYIMLETLYYLKKGGRLTPAAATLATLLRIKPVLQIQGEKLDTYSKARTPKVGRQTMINAIKSDIDKRFGGDYKKCNIRVAYTHNVENALSWKAEVEAAFPGAKILMDPLSLSVACHIGPGATAIAVTKNMFEEEY